MIDVERIRVFYSNGATIAEIARQFHVAPESIRRAMIAAGIPRRPRGQPEGKHRPAGGRTVDKSGYVLVKANHHPYANASGYVREHRLVMEGQLGRYLEPQEVVGHINGDKADNRLENLQLFADNVAHKAHDLIGNDRARGDTGNPKRSFRRRRSPEQILLDLASLRKQLGRPIRRSDLQPPNPSYRAVARAFGSWQRGVELAMGEQVSTGAACRHGRDTVRGPGDSLR